MTLAHKSSTYLLLEATLNQAANRKSFSSVFISQILGSPVIIRFLMPIKCDASFRDIWKAGAVEYSVNLSYGKVAVFN